MKQDPEEPLIAFCSRLVGTADLCGSAPALPATTRPAIGTRSWSAEEASWAPFSTLQSPHTIVENHKTDSLQNFKCRYCGSKHPGDRSVESRPLEWSRHWGDCLGVHALHCAGQQLQQLRSLQTGSSCFSLLGGGQPNAYFVCCQHGLHWVGGWTYPVH